MSTIQQRIDQSRKGPISGRMLIVISGCEELLRENPPELIGWLEEALATSPQLRILAIARRAVLPYGRTPATCSI